MIDVAVDLTELLNQVRYAMEMLATMKDHDPERSRNCLIHLARGFNRGAKGWAENNALYAQLKLLEATMMQLAKAGAAQTNTDSDS